MKVPPFITNILKKITLVFGIKNAFSQVGYASTGWTWFGPLLLLGMIAVSAPSAKAQDYPTAVSWNGNLLELYGVGDGVATYILDEQWVDQDNNVEGDYFDLTIYASGYVSYSAIYNGETGENGNAYYDFDNAVFFSISNSWDDLEAY